MFVCTGTTALQMPVLYDYSIEQSKNKVQHRRGRFVLTLQRLWGSLK